MISRTNKRGNGRGLRLSRLPCSRCGSPRMSHVSWTSLIHLGWLGGGSTIDSWSCYPPEPTPEEKTTLELKNRFFGGCTGACDDRRLTIRRKKEFRGQKDNTIRLRVKKGACLHTPAENPHPLCFYLALRAGFCTEGSVVEFLLKTNQVICCACFVQLNLPSFKLLCDALLLFRGLVFRP
jgi:hypothetical protein